eukprot:15092634-Heterocapsa_arctica.AAC.1
MTSTGEALGQPQSASTDTTELKNEQNVPILGRNFTLMYLLTLFPSVTLLFSHYSCGWSSHANNQAFSSSESLARQSPQMASLPHAIARRLRRPTPVNTLLLMGAPAAPRLLLQGGT